MGNGTRPLRLGIFGVGATTRYSARGYMLARNAGTSSGLEVAAVCDVHEEKVRRAAAELGAVAYTDFDRFLEHDTDAVLLANYFHQHAPFAVRALRAGKHVLSETTACFTLAEGVQLVEAAEASGKVYMLVENYAYFAYNMELRRLYRTGSLGEMRYGEGEYVHPIPSGFWNAISPGRNHWRNWMPMTYYLTHSLAPLLYITDTRPVRVNALVLPRDEADEEHFGKTARVNDLGSVILCTMDNDAVVKLLWGQLRTQGAWTSIRCRRGMMENLRFGDPRMVRVRREAFERTADEPIEQAYLPDFPEPYGGLGLDGHGGADYVVLQEFIRAVRGEGPAFFDVYRAVDMAAVGIQAYRSALAGGAPFEVPDFRKPAVRRKYAKDDWSPAPEHRKPGQPWPSVRGRVRLSEEALRHARADWEESGADGG